MSASVGKPQVRSLLRAFFRQANLIPNFNFREHAKRRALHGFRINQNITEPQLSIEYQNGVEKLQMVRRQAVISSLYPDMESVVVTKSKHR